MKVPVSWLRDFVDIDVSIEELARRLTLAGLEVEGIHYAGLPASGSADLPHTETSVSGLEWDRERIVVGEIREVMPHPDADRLVLTRLYDGGEEHTVLTGAPNLLPLREAGPLERPIKVAYAKEGARIYDGKSPGWELMTLRPVTIRGVESSSMACSEKELGISEDHEGIIKLDDDAEPGIPLVDYMGDAVLDIQILPNIARNANVLGVAREISALLEVPLTHPDYEVGWTGSPIDGWVKLDIREPELNPRFVLGLIEDVEIGPSPYWVQRRLRLAGMRPISTMVDATNYVMLEVGEPLHAFDYDVLMERAGGEPPTIITRLPEPNETLTTLDGIERPLDPFTILVADTAGALSIGGVMGGAESEVSDNTQRVLLEGAAWDFINIRKTVASQDLSSEAAYRFQRGVHPAMAERGVRRGLELMRQLSGGVVAEGLVDDYPRPPQFESVSLGSEDVGRLLGVELESDTIQGILERLEFSVEREGEALTVMAPDHRLDIGEGTVGRADVIEEVARIYGYDRIPETQVADRIPPQYGNPQLDSEQRVRELLAGVGLQEVVNYRQTTPERETQVLGEVAGEYVRLANPINEDRVVMRRALLPGLLSVIETNHKVRERIAIFEIGPVFLPEAGEGGLPGEPPHLAVAMRGPRRMAGWRETDLSRLEFFDLKGIIEQLVDGLHVPAPEFRPSRRPEYHPGKQAELIVDGQVAGALGELHPETPAPKGAPIVAAELVLAPILEQIVSNYPVESVPIFPPVLEDLAFIVGQEVPADEVRNLIGEAGAPLVREARLFDLYRGEQLSADEKSLAFSIVYQADDRTLTDEEVASVRHQIVEKLQEKLGAVLRES